MQAFTESRVFLERAPCDGCPGRARCLAEQLACSAFAMFLHELPASRWRSAPRVDTTRWRFEQLQDELLERYVADRMVGPGRVHRTSAGSYVAARLLVGRYCKSNEHVAKALAVQQPNVRSSIRDEEADVTYNVLAYRELSSAEVLMALRQFRATKQGRKKLKRGTAITILTIIGHNE